MLNQQNVEIVIVPTVPKGTYPECMQCM